MVYHVALLKGAYSGHKDDTLVVQARESVDALDCEAWRYLGRYDTTKVALRADRAGILERVNRTLGGDWARVIVE